MWTIDRAIEVILGIIAISAWVFKAGSWMRSREDNVDLKLLGAKMDSLLQRLERESQDRAAQFATLHHAAAQDHQRIRNLQEWKAGLLTELTKHIYPAVMVDRMFAEVQSELKTVREHVDQLLSRSERRSLPRET